MASGDGRQVDGPLDLDQQVRSIQQQSRARRGSRDEMSLPVSGTYSPDSSQSPLLPGSLVGKERAYLAAVQSGGPEQITATQAALTTMIDALLEADRSRLGGLDGLPEHRDEREFLQRRVNSLQERRDALSNGDEYPAPVTARAPEPTPRAPESKHRDDIQGLRAIAVLLVVLAHAGVTYVKGGYVGVDVFFVLSGFLITGLLLSEARTRRHVSLPDFYLRRARRILPAATLTLLVTAYAVYHLLNFVRAKQYLLDTIPSALFAANVHFAAQGTDYFAASQPPSPLQHFWSLAVEEQFYVVWPAMLAVILGLSLRRYRSRPNELGHRAVRRALIVVCLIAGASLLWSIHDTSGHPAEAYFSTFDRAWELALGAALALGASRLAELPSRARTLMGWGGLVLIGIAAVTYSAATPFPGYAALLPTIGAALLIAAGIAGYAKGSAGRALSIAPLRYVGDRSYAFYLWHWPVLVIAALYVGHKLPVSENLLLLAGAFVLSVVSYHVFERPIRNARWARKPQALLPFAIAVVAVVVVATKWVSSIDDREVLAGLHAQTASVKPLALAPATPGSNSGVGGSTNVAGSVLQAVVAAVKSPARGPIHLAALTPPVGQLENEGSPVPSNCFAPLGQTSSSICHLGDPSSSRTIVVIGDSHALMWMPALISLGQRDGWNVVPLVKLGCLVSQWTGQEHSSAGQSFAPVGECHAWFNWAMSQGQALHPEVALIGAYYSYVKEAGDPWIAQGLLATASTMKRTAKHIVIIGDPPTRAKTAVDCLLAPNATLAGCTRSLTQPDQAITQLVLLTAARAGAGFIDTTGWFCYATECPLVIGNIIAYKDDNHVSAPYATALSGAFRAAFNSLIGGGKSS
jgi:peptidoglycan/LPS O-acetylase OafA/YrhL